MAGFLKLPLSGAPRGVPLLAPSGSGNAVTLHNSVPDGNTLDELWVWAVGTGYANNVQHTLSISIGGQTLPFGVYGSSVPQMVIPGIVIAGTGSVATAVTVFADSTNVIYVIGYVNRITQ